MDSKRAMDREAVCFDRPGEIRDALRKVLRKRGVAEKSGKQRLNEVWSAAVGPMLARRSRIQRIADGVVQVMVTHHAALQELQSFHAESALTALQQQFPEMQLKRIRFRKGRS